MERFGFVGLPNAGKSSLYNALAGGGALAAPYAFATTDPNVGVAKVPDPRLDALAEMSQSRNVVPATVQFVDIGGLVEGASKGEGLGNKFLSHIREVDAIVFVLRAFADDDVPGPVRPARAPAASSRSSSPTPTSRRSRTRSRSAARRPRATSRWSTRWRRSEQAKAVLETGTPIYRSDLTDDDRAAAQAVLPPHQQAGDGASSTSARTSSTTSTRSSRRCAAELAGRAEVIGMCVQLEAEAAQLDAERAGRDARGPRPRRGRAARASSTPPTTCSACARSSPPARRSRGRGRSGPAPRRPQCAGVIHTDFERGLHPGRGDPLGRAARARVVDQGPGRRQAPRRGQGLRGRRTATSWRSASTSEAARRPHS